MFIVLKTDWRLRHCAGRYPASIASAVSKKRLDIGCLTARQVVRKLFTIAVIVVALTSVSFGQTNEVISELVTKSKVFKNARFGKVGPMEIVVYHEGGIAKVPLVELPEPWKTKYPYKEAVANKYIDDLNNLESKKLLLAELNKEIAEETRKEKSMRLYLDGWQNEYSERLIDGRVVSVISNNEVLVSDKRTDLMVIITNYPKASFDDAPVYIWARTVGRKSYTAVSGATKVVPLYDYGSENFKSDKLPKLRAEHKKLLTEISSLQKQVN